MEDEKKYRLIDEEDNKKDDEPTSKETSSLLNEYSITNSRNINSISESSSNSDDTRNGLSKLTVAVLLFHPILSLFIQDSPVVKKLYTKAQRKLIKRISIVFMLYCLIGYSLTNAPGDGRFTSFLLKLFLIIFLLIHTNIFNITNFNETIKFWKKAFNKKD